MMMMDEKWPLPEGWVWTTLGAIRKDSSKSINPAKQPDQLFELYSVPSYEVLNPEIVPGSEIGSSKRTVKENTVLLCKINPRINRVWIVGDYSKNPKIASTEWIPFEQIDGILPKYLRYYMLQNSFRDFLAQNASGVGGSLMRIKPATFVDYPFPLAPSAEQERIVAEIEKQFTRLDAAVSALRRVRGNLARYKAAVLKAACEGRLVPQDPNDEPASELLARISAERRRQWEASGKKGKYREPVGVDVEAAELPELPEGWVWATLPQLGELARGKSKHRPRNAPHLYGGSHPFIQTGEVRAAEGYITSYTQSYSDAGLAQSRLWPKDTLCITIAANIADTAILGFDACFPDSIVGFVALEDHVDVRFVEYFLRTAKARLEEFAPATAQKNINLETLQALAIPLPPLNEQHLIVDEVERRLSVVQTVEQVVEANLARAERLRQGILQRAFRGRLV